MTATARAKPQTPSLRARSRPDGLLGCCCTAMSQIEHGASRFRDETRRRLPRREEKLPESPPRFTNARRPLFASHRVVGRLVQHLQSSGRISGAVRGHLLWRLRGVEPASGSFMKPFRPVFVLVALWWATFSTSQAAGTPPNKAVSSPPVIVFMTDFGTLDDAVAICKGVMLHGVGPGIDAAVRHDVWRRAGRKTTVVHRLERPGERRYQHGQFRAGARSDATGGIFRRQARINAQVSGRLVSPHLFSCLPPIISGSGVIEFTCLSEVV
jgi:hypothetical protein